MLSCRPIGKTTSLALIWELVSRCFLLNITPSTSGFAPSSDPTDTQALGLLSVSASTAILSHMLSHDVLVGVFHF